MARFFYFPISFDLLPTQLVRNRKILDISARMESVQIAWLLDTFERCVIRMFDPLTIGLLVLIALVVLLVIALFVPKLQDKVKWVLKKAVAALIISVVTFALVVLAVQVALLSFVVFATAGIFGVTFWLLNKLFKAGAKGSEKVYLAGIDFGEKGFKTIGKTIADKAKSVWKRW